MATKLYDDDDSLDFDGVKKSRKSMPKLSLSGSEKTTGNENGALPRPKLYSTSSNSSDYYKEKKEKEKESSISNKSKEPRRQRSYSPVSRSPSHRERTPSRSPSRSRITRSPSPISRSRSISRESTGSVKNSSAKKPPQTPAAETRNAAIKPRTTYQLKYNGSLNGSKKALNTDSRHKGSSQSLTGSSGKKADCCVRGT